MTYLSVIDKIKILFSTLFDFKGVLIFGILMIIFTILYLLKKINVKRYTISMILSLVLVFLISILTNWKVLSKTFDNFMTVFFTGIYFPSIYLYISTLVIVFASFLFSIINVKLRKVYKVINRVMFVINNIIFAIILNIVAKNKIDIFSVNSLYTNTNLVALLEISMSIFLIWIASLVIAYITNSICDRMAIKKEVKEEVVETTKEEKEVINYNPIKDYVLVENINGKNYDFANEEKINIPETLYVSSHIPESVTLVHDLVPYSFKFIEEDKVEAKEETIKPFIEVKEEVKPSVGITFDDILNGEIKVDYYEEEEEDNKEDTVYTISNPQEVYESHYNSVKLHDLVENSTTSVIPEDNVITINKEDIIPEEKNITKEEVVPEKNIVIEKNNDIKEDIIIKPTVEEITNEIKSKRAVENLITNTVSLNELVDDEVLEDVKVIDKAREVSNGEVYTVEDYKKIIGMLNTLKEYSIDHNITIDDAVTISLINNYSIEDCLKFKDILESTLN